MIKVAIIGDSHYCVDSRFDECVRVHNWIAEDIARREVALCLHAGDVYERRSTPEERRAVASWAQKVTSQCPLVIVRGNHDFLLDLPLLEKLHTLHPITVVEDARVVEVAGCVVGCLGWPNKANILALAGAVSREESEQTAREALRDVLRGMGDEMYDLATASPFNDVAHSPRILLAHAMVCGSVTSVGQPLVGCDLEVALEDLALAGADLYALGHIHKGQEWTQNDGTPAIYPGSPRRTAFGELESKGYILATFDGSELVGWERIETPCAPMLLLEAEWHDEHIGLPGDVIVPASLYVQGADGVDVAGAEIRITVRVSADQRENARAAVESEKAALLARGAIAVKVVEQVIAQGSARAPEVALATTLEQKLAAYWEVRGTTPDEVRAARLVSLAKSIEEGAFSL